MEKILATKRLFDLMEKCLATVNGWKLEPDAIKLGKGIIFKCGSDY